MSCHHGLAIVNSVGPLPSGMGSRAKNRAGSPVFRPARRSRKVVLPAPLAPMSAVSTPGLKHPVMPFSNSSSFTPAASPFACPCHTIQAHSAGTKYPIIPIARKQSTLARKSSILRTHAFCQPCFADCMAWLACMPQADITEESSARCGVLLV